MDLGDSSFSPPLPPKTPTTLGPPSRSSKTPGSSRPQTTTPAASTYSNVGGVKINLIKLKAILKGYGEYPAKYR